MEERQGWGYGDYLAEFPESPIRDVVARRLWDFIHDFTIHKDFPVKAADSISDLYHIDEQEVWYQLVPGILRELGIDEGRLDTRGYDAAGLDTPLGIYNAIRDALAAWEEGQGKALKGRYPVRRIYGDPPDRPYRPGWWTRFQWRLMDWWDARQGIPVCKKREEGADGGDVDGSGA